MNLRFLASVTIHHVIVRTENYGNDTEKFMEDTTCTELMSSMLHITKRLKNTKHIAELMSSILHTTKRLKNRKHIAI